MTFRGAALLRAFSRYPLVPVAVFSLCVTILLPEASGTAAHDFTLADELGVEFRTVEGQ